MIIRPSHLAWGLAAALALTGVARAQPAGGTTPPDAGGPPPDGTTPPDGTGTTTSPDGTTPPPPPDGQEPLPAYDDGTTPPVPPPTEPELPKRRDRKIPDLPYVLTAPTGRMLPAAYIYSRSSVDTGGGLASEIRVGLGDVAEFGVATTDLIRARRNAAADPERIAPYILASFRLGVAEERLFHYQPAFAIGFRKSFEADRLGAKTRVAELNFVMSKNFFDKVAVHAGLTFWDASLDDGTGEVTFHDEAEIKEQLRPIGGIEFRAKRDAEILVDLSWNPSFCYDQCMGRKFRLDPLLSWGVRYLVADWIHIEAGVRVPDIRDINLLDAQIFGQLTLITDRLRKAVDRLSGSD